MEDRIMKKMAMVTLGAVFSLALAIPASAAIMN